jgi:hypothetical protein
MHLFSYRDVEDLLDKHSTATCNREKEREKEREEEEEREKEREKESKKKNKACEF